MYGAKWTTVHFIFLCRGCYMQSEMNSYPLNSISLDFFYPTPPTTPAPLNYSVVCSVHFTSSLQNPTFSASLWYAKTL